MEISGNSIRIKTILLIIIFHISPVIPKSLKPITINTKWTYNVSRSNPFYAGKFIEKIEVQEIFYDTIDKIIDLSFVENIGILYRYLRIEKLGQPAQISIITDNIFRQSLDPKTIPCHGATADEVSYPAVNSFLGCIIQTDSLRFQVINNYLIYVIPITYDSAKYIHLSERNYFSERCENLIIDKFEHHSNSNTKAEFWGMITTEWTNTAIIDSNGIRELWFSDYSDMQPCNGRSTATELDTNKLLIRHSEKMCPKNVLSNSNYTGFLLNGRVIGTARMNSSGIGIVKSGNNTIKSPIVQFRNNRN